MHQVIEIERLTGHQRRQVEALAHVCRQHDGLEVPVHVEPARSDGERNQFLVYDGDALVGFALLPSGEGVEVLGVVHPQHRRQGIGRALLSAVREECRRRALDAFLVVCEEDSLTGRAFVDHAGGTYRFSEYRMELAPEAFVVPNPGGVGIDLAPADADDLGALVDIRTSAFGSDEAVARSELTRWLGEPEQELHVARLGGNAIGMVRVATYGTTTFINSFAVRPEFQGRGHGRKILVQTLQRLLADDRALIKLEVETDNRGALSLYQSCGFREVAAYRYYRMRA